MDANMIAMIALALLKFGQQLLAMLHAEDLSDDVKEQIRIREQEALIETRRLHEEIERLSKEE